MSVVKQIRWKRSGFRKVLMSSPVRDELGRRARAIATAAAGGGDSRTGYAAVTGTGRSRARAAVLAWSFRARRHNAKHNAILRSIDAGRS